MEELPLITNLIKGSTQIAGGAAITNNWGLFLENIDKNKLDGTLQLPTYGQGNVTGTAAKNLAVDSNGNVIETDGGVVDGSGTTTMYQNGLIQIHLLILLYMTMVLMLEERLCQAKN